MNHKFIENHMAEYLDGELALDSRALFDAHLDGCAQCSRELREMRATIAMLHSLPDPEPPPTLVPDVMRRIRAGEGRASFIAPIRDWLGAILAPPVLYPVSAALLAVGLLLATGQVQILLPGPTATRQLVASAARPAMRATGELRALASVREEADPHAGFRLIIHPNASLPAPLGAGSANIPESTLLAELTRVPLGSGPRPPLAPMLSRSHAHNGVRTGEPAFETVGLSRSVAGAEDGVPGSPGTTAHALPTPEQWLVLVERSPGAFAEKIASLSLAEQELWVDRLARRASEQGNLSKVVFALRSSGSARASLLADAFATAGADVTPMSDESASGRN